MNIVGVRPEVTPNRTTRCPPLRLAENKMPAGKFGQFALANSGKFWQIRQIRKNLELFAIKSAYLLEMPRFDFAPTIPMCKYTTCAATRKPRLQYRSNGAWQIYGKHYVWHATNAKL